LNAIVDDDAITRAGLDLIDVARAFVVGGATFIQLRAKKRSSAWMLETADALLRASRYGGQARLGEVVQIIINDRADVARMSGAAGVHVGQEDLAPEAVRALVGPDGIIGFSTHSVAQLDAAVTRPIDYVAVGPIFGTASKDTGYDAVGLRLVEEAAKRAQPRGLGVVAIGGITLDRAPDVIRAGATSVAIISDLLATGDPRGRVSQYLDRLAQVGGV